MCLDYGFWFIIFPVLWTSYVILTSRGNRCIDIKILLHNLKMYTTWNKIITTFTILTVNFGNYMDFIFIISYYL